MNLPITADAKLLIKPTMWFVGSQVQVVMKFSLKVWQYNVYEFLQPSSVIFVQFKNLPPKLITKPRWKATPERVSQDTNFPCHQRLIFLASGKHLACHASNPYSRSFKSCHMWWCYQKGWLPEVFRDALTGEGIMELRTESDGHPTF